MAHDNQEIEIKIPVSEETFLMVREKLLAIARPGPKTNQVDRYFTPGHRSFVEPRYPFEWLSVRRRGGKAILTYKHWYPENQELNTHCDEFETELSDPEQMERILKVLDFRELVTVDKTRETFYFEGKFEVCLDQVRDLGFFVEIEATADLGSVEETRARLLEFAARIGLPEPVMDKRGYPYELMKKKGLLK
jgi:adenylate cyclase, class 2